MMLLLAPLNPLSLRSKGQLLEASMDRNAPLTDRAAGSLRQVLFLLGVVLIVSCRPTDPVPQCPGDASDDEGDPHPGLHDAELISRAEDCRIDRVRDQAERDRMQAYIDSLVPAGAVIARLALPSGDSIDCVDIQRQPALRLPALEGHVVQLVPRTDPTDPEEDRGRTLDMARDPADSGQLRILPQEYLGEVQCPQASVPIRRLTMDILSNFETLEDFFRKRVPHDVNGPTGLHQWTWVQRDGDNWGAQTVLNVWSPYTNRSSEFSLSQMWVTRGAGADKETVEAGWQKYRDLYGDYRPRLFIYFTPDNYGSGGCYNLTCSAFVQVNNSIFIGGGFTDISSHPHPSTVWEFKLRWQKDREDGHWWLKYGDTWVGYYPRSLFDSDGLRDHAGVVKFGGEIIDEQVSGDHTRTDMGSGHFPGDGFGYAAYQRQVRFITTSNVWGMRPDVTDHRTDADCYDLETIVSSGSWERYFYFGGPGNWAHCR